MKKFLIAMMLVQFLAMSNAPVALALEGTKTSGLLIAAISENPISENTEFTTAAVTTSGATQLPDLSPAPLPATDSGADSAVAPTPVDDPSKAVSTETVKVDDGKKSEQTIESKTVKTDSSWAKPETKVEEAVRTESVKTEGSFKTETPKSDVAVKSETVDSSPKAETTKTGESTKTESVTTVETEKSAKTEAILPTTEAKATADVTKSESTAVGTPVVPADLQATVKTDAIQADNEKIASIAGTATGAEPIVIDNDEAVETEQSIKYEALPTDEGKE